MTPGKSFVPVLDRLARRGSVFAICVGSVVAFGWFANVQIFKSVLPGLATMKMSTALGFILAGVSLWLLHTSVPGSNARRAARVLALCVIAIAVLTIAEDIFSLDLGIDQLIVRDADPNMTAHYPGRMSPITSVCFLVVGVVLLELKSSQRRFAIVAHWLTLLPLFLSLVAILGYVYGVSSLYEVMPYASMAIHTALTFFILTLSIKAADPLHGIANIMSSDTAGGVVCRRLLPTVPTAIFVLGYIRLEGQRAGLYDTQFGLALMVSISMTVCVLAIVLTAYTLRRVDLTRKQAQAEVFGLSAGLHDLLQQRMQQLAQLSAALAENKFLEQISLHDGLTGIANRRFFDTYLTGQIAIARRHNRTLALILCDVDAFKPYNDHYGHQAGDACLTQVATALRACCQRPADMAARYGGEEFALILPDTELAGAEMIAEAARNAIAGLAMEHAHSACGSRVSISGGIAMWKMDMSAAQLIAAADESLFRAKRGGRNRMISARAA